MKIGIIGAGHIGGTLAKLWARSGHDCMVSSRHPDMLSSFVNGNKHLSAGTVEQASSFGEVVFLAIPLKGIFSIIPKIKNNVNGKTVLDAMNPFIERDGEIAQEIKRRKMTSGEFTQEHLTDAKIIRAFSSVPYSYLLSESAKEGEKIAIPYAGNDVHAKETASLLIENAGFIPFDLGTLEDSKPLDPDGALFGKALTVRGVRMLLE